VLNTLNTRLDAETLAFMLEHGEARVLITDREYSPAVKKVLAALQRQILVIDVDDPSTAAPANVSARASTRSSSPAAVPISPGVVRPTNGMRSRSITPREPPATRRGWSTTIAAPISIR
jgi:acyl-CoA synthetase (AMP-forming)/AMP-acid ligase II